MSVFYQKKEKTEGKEREEVKLLGDNKTKRETNVGKEDDLR